MTFSTGRGVEVEPGIPRRSPRWAICLVAAFSLALWLAAAGEVSAQAAAEGEGDESGPRVEQRDGPAFWVDVFDLRIKNDHPDFPKARALKAQTIELAEIDGHYVAPRLSDDVDVQTTLAALEEKAPVRVHLSALEAIGSRIERLLRQRTARGVQVEIAEGQIDPASGEDQRPFADLSLALTVDGTFPSYTLSKLQVDYARSHPDLPAIAKLRELEIPLGKHEGGFVGYRESMEKHTVVPAEAAWAEGQVFYPSAIRSINERLVGYLNDRGLVGVFASPSREDLRRARREASPLRLAVNVARVGDIRTLASGERVDPDARTNHELHRWIRKRSPLEPASTQPAAARTPASGRPVATQAAATQPGPAATQPQTAEAPEQGDLIRRDELNRYVHWLNRHPGRSVDTSIAAGEGDNQLVLDYLVNESKPWFAFVQVSNTGTEQTDDIREQFGLVHNQLTNNDDILRLNYVTTSFDESNAVVGSYEAPVGDSRRLRWRVEGSWNEYTASEVGQAGEQFEGEGWRAGGELSLNVLQDQATFLDVYAGAKWQHTEVINRTFQAFGLIVEGEEDFFIPRLGIELDRQTDQASTTLDFGVDGNVQAIAGTDEDELPALGRSQTDAEWVRAYWDLQHSFYLEPLLNPEGWADPSTPESSTLAHEVAVTLRGQYAFDNRLVPNFEQTIGGLYTVRGFPESVAAGDNVVNLRTEYRFHLPRIFSPREPGEMFGEPFRWAPQRVYGSTDWDLILRTFLDYGRTVNADRVPNVEQNHSLLGAGVGAELRIKNNITLRGEWGFALDDEEFAGSDDVEAGDSEFHFLATFLY